MWSLLLLAAASSTPETRVIPRSPAQLAAVTEAERAGRDIFDFDEAAWGSTDALVAQIPDPGKAGVRGWIVEREPGGTIAIFYGLNGNDPYKLFVAHMRGKKVLSSRLLGSEEDRSMTEIERRMVAARAVALSPEAFTKAAIRPCTSAAINSVVLPPATVDAAVPVYILTPQATLQSFPIGGHYRIDVAPDGSIAHSRAFAKSCITMDRAQMPAGVRMFFVTHLMDPQPTEIHVWVSLAGGVPLAVGTSPAGDVWGVVDGRIRYQYTLPIPSADKP